MHSCNCNYHFNQSILQEFTHLCCNMQQSMLQFATVITIAEKIHRIYYFVRMYTNRWTIARTYIINIISHHFCNRFCNIIILYMMRNCTTDVCIYNIIFWCFCKNIKIYLCASFWCFLSTYKHSLSAIFQITYFLLLLIVPSLMNRKVYILCGSTYYCRCGQLALASYDALNGSTVDFYSRKGVGYSAMQTFSLLGTCVGRFSPFVGWGI